jgi:hypothetical protein
MTIPRQPRLDSSSTADQRQRRGLAGEAADHLGAPAHLDEGALEQVGGPDPLAVLGGPAQVRDQGVEVALDDRHRRRIGGPVVGDDGLESAASLGRRGGLVEHLPPARLELAVWRSGSFAVTFLSACTVQRCSSAAGHSSLAAFHRPGAPSATMSAGAFMPRATRSRPNDSHDS